MLALEVGEALGHGGRALADAFGDVGVLGEVALLDIGGVAAEQLVGAFAGKNDLHILPGVFRQEVEGDFGGIGEGLVHEVLDLGGGSEIVVGGDFIGDVLDPHHPGEVLGVGELAVFFLGVAYGEGFHVLGDLGDFLDHVAGIHAAGQEAAHLHVADLVGFHGLGELVGNQGFPFFQGLGVVDAVPDVVVLPNGHLALAIGEALAAQEFVDVFEQGLLGGDVLVAHVVGEPVGVDLPFKGRVFQEGFDLGAVEEVAVLFVVVEGLDAEDVPGAEKGLGGLVPDDEGEHAPELLEKLLAVLLVAVEEDFGVGVGLENVAFFQQVLPQVPVVVNFAVEGQDFGAVLIQDGLAAAVQVDDGKTAEAHGDAIVHVVVGLVGAPVGDAVGHGANHGQAVACEAVGGKTGKSAHWLSDPFGGNYRVMRFWNSGFRGFPQNRMEALARTSMASR